MPELPDVEIYRRYLASTALRKKIAAVEVRTSKILEEVSVRRLKRTLEGRVLESAARHGKYLFGELDGSGCLVLHFGMSGFLRYFRKPEGDTGHDRLALEFENGERLVYDNQRLLGRVFLAESVRDFVRRRGLGPDALAVDLDEFRGILGRGRGSVKSTLMNQKMLAGLGNIYTDEILFQTRIHPETPVDALGEADSRSLFDAMREVFRTAIDARSDPGDMPRSFLLPRRKEGEECPRCGGKVKKISVSGRSTYICPDCQEKRR